MSRPHRSVRTSRLASFFAIAALALAPLPARAQCSPDLFDTVPCCNPVVPSLPVIPAVSQTSKFICFRDCATQANVNLCVDIDPPQPITIPGGAVCGVYLIRFKVKTCGGGQILWQGNLRAHYSRNWLEIDPTGVAVGVWRFLLNGDMKPTAFLLNATTSPNFIPSCRTSFGNKVYFGGYVDYAFDCGTSAWTAAWALNHDCDTFHHPTGGFSPRPAPGAGFHPTRTFTFVGPGAGFVVDPVTTPVPVGPSVADALRWNDWGTLPNICRGEEKVAGSVQSFGSFCVCTLSSGPAQYENTSVNVAGGCGSAVQPSPVIFTSKRIGRWTNAVVFPGLEDLNVNLGYLTYTNACKGTNTLEFFEGATTLGGNPGFDYFMQPLDRAFMDIGTSNKNPNNTVIWIGVPHVTEGIANINVP